MNSYKEKLILEYVECPNRQKEIMNELSIEEAIQLFYTLTDAGIYP